MKPNPIFSLWRNPPTCPPKPHGLYNAEGRRRIRVRVKPNSKEEKVEPLPDGDFLVRVKAPAKEGRANEAVIRALGEYLARPKRLIRIAGGSRSRIKIVEIL